MKRNEIARETEENADRLTNKFHQTFKNNQY